MPGYWWRGLTTRRLYGAMTPYLDSSGNILVKGQPAGIPEVIIFVNNDSCIRRGTEGPTTPLDPYSPTALNSEWEAQVLVPIILDQGGQVFNVKSYGAFGDGTTDDTQAIQAAINAANTAGGGWVYLPQGTYITTLLTLYSRVHLWGAGIEATIIKLKAGANTAALQSSGFAGLTGGNTQGGIFNFSLQNLTVDGNKVNQSVQVALIQIYGYGYILDNVRVRNSLGDGIYSEWSTVAGSPGQDSMEAQLANIKAHDNGAMGVNWNGPHDSQWVNGVCYNNGTRGVWVQSKGNGLLMTNVHCWGNSQVWPFFIEGSGCGLINCVGEGASAGQLFLGANDCWVMGGTYFAAGGATTGIVIGDVSHTSLSGLKVDTKVLNCTTAAISLAQDGGGNIFRINAFQASGPVSTGTLANNSILEAVVSGGGTGGGTTLPGGVTLRSGNALTLNKSDNSAFSQMSFDGAETTNSWPIRGTTFIGVQGASAYYSGSGAPAGGTGANGDYYFRTDTPGTANQRLYVKSAGTWSGIL